MENNTSVKVVIRKSPTNKKVGNIHIRTITNRKAKFKSLNIQLNLIHWDKNKLRVLPSLKENYKKHNKEIEKALKELEENHNNLNTIEDENTIILKYWYNHNLTSINSSTESNRNVNRKKFKTFLEINKIEQLKFKQLTVQLVEWYERFLIENLKRTTVNTYMGLFKAVINKAIREQIIYYRVHPFINHTRLTNKNKKAKSLSIEQLKGIMELNIISPKTNYFRNMFIFQILGGGLRVRDLMTLKWKNIITNENGIYLNYEQGKSHKEMTTKLSFKALSYLTPILSLTHPQMMVLVNDNLSYLNNTIAASKHLPIEINNPPPTKYNTTDDGTHYLMEDLEFKEDYKKTIEHYTIHLNIQYGTIINELINTNPKGYIFKSLVGITIPENNTDARIKNKVQGKISCYNNQLTKIAKQVNIPRFTSHTARHTFTQLLVDKNTNLHFIQQMLGHSSLMITQNYVFSIGNNQLDEISDSLADLF